MKLKLFSLIAVLVAVAAVAVAQDSGMPATTAEMISGARENLSASFWGGIDHVANVLVDFIGRIFMKLADAVLAVLHGVGIGTGR